MIHRNISLVCVGDQDVGKNTLLRCLARNGQKIESEEVFLFNHETIELPVDATFTSLVTIKNTSGKEDLESIRKEVIGGAEGVLACFSLVLPKTLESLVKKWIPEVRSILGADVPILLIGTKLDARNNDREADKRESKHSISKEAESISRKHKLAGFYEVSAFEGIGVKDAVIEILKASTLYKVKHGRPQSSGRSSPSSLSGSPRTSILSRFIPIRSSTKVRLSQRLLEVAAQGETTEALELLSKGAHASYATSGEDKTSPLHIAARAGNLDMLNILLYARADVNLKDANGCTPLHVACSNDHYDCAKALLDRGADINARNLVASTPLHDAAGAGARSTVMLLLERGSDETLLDIGDHTARQRAEIAGFPLLFLKQSDLPMDRSSFSTAS